jgi:hypothetical protein
MKLSSLISSKEARHKMLCFLYHYRHLNDTDFTNLSSTNFITHRVILKSDIKSINNFKQRRWSIHTEWWMRKIVIDDIKDEVYELVESANEWLSLWNARAIIVDKVKNFTSQNESRVTFDYSRIHEELFDSFLKLFFKVHDNLFDSRHKVFFSIDLKHVYLIISMHSNDRHYFAFFISSIDQVQFIRIQQNSKFVEFIMTKLIYKAFDSLSSSADLESSFLHSTDSHHLSVLIFYMNDFFERFQNFDDLYEFLRAHFLSRIEWVKLRLFFRKMHLFEDKVKTLKIISCVDDFIKILENRIKKIAKWSIFVNQTDVRVFVDAVEIIRRWIRNFAKLIRSLTRLTDKVDWRWIDSEQLFFEIIRIKIIIKSIMHEINLNDEIHFYTNSSAYAANMTITQFRSDHIEKIVKMLIMYDSFFLLFSRRKYFTYKKKLYAMITFVTKYDYLCKHFYKSAIIHIDHRSLIHFLKSNAHEDIYDHWANQLRRLNIVIKYISELRNKVANALFRILFFDEKCFENIAVVIEILKKLETKRSEWIWKDEKDDFEKFLAFVSLHRSEILERDIMNDVSIFVFDAVSARSSEFVVKKFQSSSSADFVTKSRRDSFKKASKFIEKENTWKFAYETSIWFVDIYFFLKNQRQDVTVSLMRRTFDYRLVNDILWIHREDFYLSCISEKKMLNVLRDAHDNSSHWIKIDIIAKIHDTCYWSEMILDVERYMTECLKCVRHESARRSQSLHSILTTYSFQLIDMNFIDSLTKTKSAKHTHILNIVCYFSRFMISFACRFANVKNVTWSFRLFISMYRTLHVIYCDRDQHFDNEMLRDFLKTHDIVIDYSSSDAFKSTDMMKMFNRLLEEIFRKSESNTNNTWDLRLAKIIKAVNERIISYLDINSSTINFERIQETSSINATILHLFDRDIRTWHDELIISAIHCNHVRIYLNHRAEIHDMIQITIVKQRENDAAKYNREIFRTIHHSNDLVMLWQKKTRKLKSRWRDSFRISDYDEFHEVFFTFVQLNDRKIRDFFHEDHLKTFTSKEEYLIRKTSEEILSQFQIIRKIRVRKTWDMSLFCVALSLFACCYESNILWHIFIR